MSLPRGRGIAAAFGLALFFAGRAASAQSPSAGPADPLAFAHVKDFDSFRASSGNPDPASNFDFQRMMPGETITLADLKGPGVITHVWLTIAASEFGWPRLLRLRAYYDGSDEPSVDSPVGDFFGVGHGYERPVNSMMVRDGSQGRARNSYWPMPFAKSCRITLTNEGRRYVEHVYDHVDWQKLAALPAGTLYFHARYRQALPAPADGKPYVLLNVQGRGFYAGTVFSVLQPEAGWFGEGDDRFFIDGRAAPSIEGTGSEDYFNDAWGLHVEEGPYFGVPVAEGTGLGTRMTAYRWHVVDPIAFRTSLRFEIEHKGWTYNADGSIKAAFGERTDLYSSVSFWYQEGIARGLPAIPYGSARLPQGNATQIEAEERITGAKAQKGQASVSKDLFWSKDVLLFEAEGAGATLEIPFDVDQGGDYELSTQIAQGSDYGIYRVLLDGKPAVAPVLEHEPGADVRPQTSFDGYFYETSVGLEYPIGWPRLSTGRHTVTFVCLGKNAASSGYTLGVDNLILARTGEEGWGRARQVRPPRVPSDVPGLASALSDSDPVVRGLAARSLRDRGATARTAVDALAARLTDGEWTVRMAAAEALRAIGSGAAAAVPALSAALGRVAEPPHVLRACAEALGAIGPPASPAAPRLRELAARRITYVGGVLELSPEWAARQALERIEKRP
ncbi:MAG: DUF2961 domain-containing protein [Acidobacteriota bacterium]